jgi:CubicO group peptidase (beta-lactamase class C family)
MASAAGRLFGAAAVLGAGAGAAWVWKNQAQLAMRRPFNEWTFTHTDTLLPTDKVSRPARVHALPGRSHALGVTYSFQGKERDLGELHARTHTTSFLVLHRGEIVHEVYPGRFAAPGVRFQMFSLTKSVTSMLIGIAIAEGSIKDVTEQVTAYLPEFVNTAYDGATIENLLDMCSGAGGYEDYEDPNSTICQFERAITNGGDVHELVRDLDRTSEPGVRFNYSTLDSQVLGWLLEAATGLPLATYATSRLWEPMGAEFDAFYFLTRRQPRTAIGGGSMNAATRDLARLGLLMARGGELGGRRIVPEAWALRSRGRAVGHLEPGALGLDWPAHYGYSNQWWTLGGGRRAFTGIGIHGQYIYVDPDADVVIVKTGAWPVADDEDRDLECLTAFQAIVQKLT